MTSLRNPFPIRNGLFLRLIRLYILAFRQRSDGILTPWAPTGVLNARIVFYLRLTLTAASYEVLRQIENPACQAATPFATMCYCSV